VSAGAPDHLSAGETFWPEQPKPVVDLLHCDGAVGRMSGLVSLNAARAARFFPVCHGDLHA